MNLEFVGAMRALRATYSSGHFNILNDAGYTTAVISFYKSKKVLCGRSGPYTWMREPTAKPAAAIEPRRRADRSVRDL